MTQVLFFGAQSMFANHDRRKTVRFGFIEGQIKTDYRYGVLGSVSGCQFEATIETERGKTLVRYLVKEADFKVTPPESFSFTCLGGNEQQESLNLN